MKVDMTELGSKQLASSPTDRIRPYQWKPGQSGNPSGRAKMPVSLVKLLKERLESNPEDAKAIVAALVALGKKADLPAIKELFERIDGKVAEKHTLDTEGLLRLEFIPASVLLAKQEQARLEQANVIEGESHESKGTGANGQAEVGVGARE